MPCVVRDGTYSVYVYARDHPPPHCHVYWKGDRAALVDLMTLQPIAGDRLPRQGKALVRANVAALQAAWDQLNP